MTKKINNFNNISTELIEDITSQVKYINTIDTSTEEGKDDLRREQDELNMMVSEYWSDDVSEWIYE